MTLIELATPIFLFVVALRRKIRRNVPLDYGEVKREALALFTRIEAQASAKGMTDRWLRAKVALVYLVDEVAIMETWPGAESWNNHSLEVEYLGHDEKMRGVWFFDPEYQRALESGDPDWMEIMYVCLSLGFEGRHRGQQTQLRNHMDNLLARLPVPFLAGERDAKMFPECYVVDRTSNDPRAPMRFATAATILVGILVTYGVVTHVAYNNFVGQLAALAGRIANLR